MSWELQGEIARFLYHEARLLDHHQYLEWLGLLTRDVSYRAPVRVTRERKDGSDLFDEMALFDETWDSLQRRVKRLYVKSAWVADPPPRHHHLVTNVMVNAGDDPDACFATSSFLVVRSRRSGDLDHVIGEREDGFRREDGSWKLASRLIMVDEAVLQTPNLSMFL